MASLCDVCGLQAFLLDSACQGTAQASGGGPLSIQSQWSVPDQMLGHRWWTIRRDAEILDLSDFRSYLQFLPFLGSVIFLLFHRRKEFEDHEPRNPRYFSPLMPHPISFYYLTMLLGLAIIHCPSF